MRSNVSLTLGGEAVPAELIDGKAISQERQRVLSKRVEQLSNRGVTPCLAAVSVGGDPAWDVYQKRQAKACANVGIDYRRETLAANATQQDLSERIEALNADHDVHGIIIQSPLPGNLNALGLQAQLSPSKDVEAVSPANLGLVLADRHQVAPCTAVAAIILAEAACPNFKGKEVVIVGSSVIVGKPIAQLLLARGATPTICHIDTHDVAAHTKRADVIFVAVGKPKLLSPEMVKPGAIVIDVGINQITDENGKRKVVGDVDPAVAEVASALSPVPGGVGSVTTTVLLEATVAAAEAQQELRPSLDGQVLTHALGDRAKDIPPDLADDLARLMSQHMVQLPGDANLRGPFERRIDQAPVILDGAIGTELIDLGVDVGSIDRANIEQAALVKKVHQSYVEVGVDIITANTFGCNRFRLGSVDEAIRLAQAGIRIARQASRGRALVFASMGPLGQVVGAEISPDEAVDAFAEIALCVSDAGADGFCVETMTSTAEAVAAISGIRQVSRLPIMVTRNLQRDDAEEIQDFVKAMEQAGVQAIGVNCITGVRSLTPIIRRMASLTDLPIIARPNAGHPQHIDGRYHYHLGPDYFCKKVKEFIQTGARLVGGCCGIGPKHIAAVTQVRQELPEPQKPSEVPAIKIYDREDAHNCPLKNAFAAKQFLRLAMMAPMNSAARIELAEVLQDLDGIGILSAWGNQGDGVAPIARLRHLQDVSSAPAILEIDAQQDLLDIQEQLRNAHLLGIHIVVIDAGVFSSQPVQAHAQRAHVEPMQLIHLVRQLNSGRNMSGSRLDSHCTFTIGVRVNPSDCSQLQQFADAGADFALLQPVYDPKAFRACMKGYDQSLPLIAEVLILSDLETAEEIDNEIPALSVPQRLKDRLSADPEEDVRGVLKFIDYWQEQLAGVCMLLPNEQHKAAQTVLKLMAQTNAPS